MTFEKRPEGVQGENHIEDGGKCVHLGGKNSKCKVPEVEHQ